MATTVRGNVIDSTWSTYIAYTVTTGYSATQAKVVFDYGIYFNKKHNHETKFESVASSSSNAASVSGNVTIPSGDFNLAAGSYKKFGSITAYYNKGTAAYTGYWQLGIKHFGKYAKWVGTSTVKASFSIPARATYAVTYYGNKPSSASGSVSNVPSKQTKYYGYNLTLSSTKPTLSEWSFQGWATSSGGSVAYNAGSTYTGNAALNLYAKWVNVKTPTIGGVSKTVFSGHLPDSSSGAHAIKNFTTMSVSFTGATAYGGRSITKAELLMGSTVVATLNSSQISGGAGTFTFTPNISGTYNMTVRVTDSGNYTVSRNTNPVSVKVANPTWTKECTFDSDVVLPPAQASNGAPVLTTVKIYNYTTSTWDTVTVNTPLTIGENTWSFPYTFSEKYVSSPTSLNPTTKIKVAYTHYNTVETVARRSFFSTSRNQNFSNGIYNVMFLGGVDVSLYPDYSSRVWWCYINNPLYFPDTNYLEVGSNDTSIQGLTKVGDYLAVIKQAKTTDTAVYLVYPTSFEDETTYAVRQGVQGVGAISRYGFNILGDETLFLSPNGVMAIVPSQDDEHKTQNRSYFIDKKLLSETDLTNAYSFVYDGKYWLSTGEHCYVLDGNQRNSWGNDKTNLVYECYYLENVPAKCFAILGNTLLFSTDDEVCRFYTGDGDEFYKDAFKADSPLVYKYTPQDVSQEWFESDPTQFSYMEDGEYVQCDELSVYDSEEQYYTRVYEHEIVDVPVTAEWSTVFDDDNAIHYYKTMQKKGNAVSVLPNGYRYVVADIDEETYNGNPTKYYTFDGVDYHRCGRLEPFSEDEVYFFRDVSNTKVYIRKDDKEPVEIQRIFNELSDIPSEMFLKKKFKKYKRLQFIIRNEAPEPFGVDSIIKNYTVGNYAKK